MKTYILEGVVTALTKIAHNGGQTKGNIAKFRRETKFDRNLKPFECPVISGNSVRGMLRDMGAKMTLNHLADEEGKPAKVNLNVFQLLFSGGALTSGNTEGDIEFFKNMRADLQHVSLFGGGWGNALLPGRMNVNEMLPICAETLHLIPEKLHPVATDENPLPSVRNLTHLGMYTRKENASDPALAQYLEIPEGQRPDSTQMIYYFETLSAGTKMYWSVVLEDVTAEEFAYFCALLARFRSLPFVGGKKAVGFGKVELAELTWRELALDSVDAALTTEEKDMQQIWEGLMAENKDKALERLKSLKA